jgi:iron complex transport system ATP-binding protein
MNTLTVDRLIVRRGARSILSAIDLTFAAGSLTAILGPNGAGKSTLLSCMAGLLQPQQGSVEIDGACIATMRGPERARQIAFLQQTPEIAWPIDVETLVGLARIPHAGAASDAQNRAAVAHAMQITATTQWAKRVVNHLSGGERARVLLARIFAGESRWILADEPFTGLDPAHQFEAVELLRAFTRQGGGVILTIHDLSLAARIADRIVVLNEGRIAADGLPAAALNPTLLREVYGVDTEWLVAGTHRKTPLIAIHGRHVG